MEEEKRKKKNGEPTWAGHCGRAIRLEIPGIRQKVDLERQLRKEHSRRTALQECELGRAPYRSRALSEKLISCHSGKKNVENSIR